MPFTNLIYRDFQRMLFQYLDDRNIFRYLLTCSAIRPYLKYHRIKRSLPVDRAVILKELSEDRVLTFKDFPEVITSIHDVLPEHMPILKNMTSLTSLTLADHCISLFNFTHFPPSVTRLSMTVNHEKRPWISLSLSITDMELTFTNGQTPHKSDLPDGLQSLMLHGEVALPNGWLPSSVTHLELPDIRSQDLDEKNLPASLLSLCLGKHFCGELSAPALLHLTLDTALYWEMFPSGLPPNLQSLKSYFNPAYISPPMALDSPGDGFPVSLTHLVTFQLFNEGCLPKSLTHLTYHVGGVKNDICLSSTVIPRSVTHLVLRFKNGFTIPVDAIPDSVTHLSLDGSFKLKQKVVPSSVTHLSLGGSFNRSLEPLVVPNSVTDLSFGNTSNQPFEYQSIPDSVLKCLAFSCQPLPPIDVSHVTAHIDHLNELLRPRSLQLDQFH